MAEERMRGLRIPLGIGAYVRAPASSEQRGAMRISSALVAIAVCLPAVALAQPRWTFCIGASKSGADVWITGVFAADRDRKQLENTFRVMLERTGAHPD